MGTDAKHRSRSREKYDRRKERSRSRSRDRKKDKKKKRSRSRSRERGGDRGGRGEGGRREERPHTARHEQEEEEEHKFGMRLSALKQEGGGEGAAAAKGDKPKEGVNLGLSGALTEETNTFRGVVIKYSEPPEARKPKRRWRFYVFKGEEVMPTLHLHRQSAFLLGRDRKICDLPIDHPSCSKQHAVFQYRLVSKKTADGSEIKRVLPYIIDLGSANGTYLNNQKIEPQRYYELKEKDMLKFGYSSREYVLLHEESGDD